MMERKLIEVVLSSQLSLELKSSGGLWETVENTPQNYPNLRDEGAFHHLLRAASSPRFHLSLTEGCFQRYYFLAFPANPALWPELASLAPEKKVFR